MCYVPPRISKREFPAPDLRVENGSKSMIINMINRMLAAVLEGVQIYSGPAGRICTQTTNKKAA